MNENRSDEWLRTVLRAGDPAADGTEPNTEEVAQLRRLTLNHVPERRPILRWLPVTAAAIAVFATILLAPGGDAPRQPADLTADETAPSRRQQVQFATENGTRIIWVLDPELTL